MTAANKQNKGYCAKCGTPPRNAKFKSSDYKGFEIPEAVKGTDLVPFFLQNQSNNRICSTCQNSLNETIKIRGIDVNGRILPQARLCQPLPPPELTAPVDDRKEPIFLDTPLGFKHTIRIDAIIDDFMSRVNAPSPQNNTTTATAADQVHIERSIDRMHRHGQVCRYIVPTFNSPQCSHLFPVSRNRFDGIQREFK